MQDGKPISYASKTQTPTDKGYAQIDEEMLAILFGCSRYENYIFWRHTVVESECNAIESIMKKPLAMLNQGLQRLMLQLQQYDIEVIHVLGKISL